MTWEDLKNESTPDLIEYIMSINDPGYKELAEAAFIVLTFRFRSDLIKKCVIMCRKWNRTEDDAVELSNRVIARFLKYPKYKASECKSGKTDDCFKRYLYGIANREIITLFKPEDSPFDGSEKVIHSLINKDTSYEPEKLKELQAYEIRLDKIFANLSPKHKIIFLTYKQYENEGHTLPRHLLCELRDILNLTQSTIRVYKKEAYEAVNKNLKNG